MKHSFSITYKFFRFQHFNLRQKIVILCPHRYFIRYKVKFYLAQGNNLTIDFTINFPDYSKVALFPIKRIR